MVACQEKWTNDRSLERSSTKNWIDFGVFLLEESALFLTPMLVQLNSEQTREEEGPPMKGG